MMEIELVLEQVRKKENIGAALAIGTLWPDITNKLIVNLAELVRQRIELENGSWEMEVNFDYFSAYSGFCFYRKGQWSKYRIKCEFDEKHAREFFYGVTKCESHTPDAFDKRIASKLDSEYTQKKYPNSWWAWWQYFEPPYRDWNSSADSWSGIHENGATVELIYSKLKWVIETAGKEIDKVEAELTAAAKV